MLFLKLPNYRAVKLKTHPFFHKSANSWLRNSLSLQPSYLSPQTSAIIHREPLTMNHNCLQPSDFSRIKEQSRDHVFRLFFHVVCKDTHFFCIMHLNSPNSILLLSSFLPTLSTLCSKSGYCYYWFFVNLVEMWKINKNWKNCTTLGKGE